MTCFVAILSIVHWRIAFILHSFVSVLQIPHGLFVANLFHVLLCADVPLRKYSLRIEGVYKHCAKYKQ